MKSTNQSKKRNTIILIIAAAISTASIAHAGPPWDQTQKLLASDGAGGDEFGSFSSVAVSGNTAVIGAFGDDDSGTDSGSAYVFDITTGQQLFKLLPADGDSLDLFGNSVTLSGNIAVIGARSDDDNGSNSGSVYVFDVATGQQLFKLLPSDGAASDFFGNSVAISGNIAVVGAFADDDNGTDSGSAYVFDVTTGGQIFKLIASDGAVSDNFGSVAVNGNIAVIGANRDDDNGTDSGSAYVFDVTTGEQLFKLLAADGAAGDIFGNSVVVSGNTAIIGAQRTDDLGTDSGSAYVFQQRPANNLTITPNPLIAKQDGTFTITQALPNQLTGLIYSLDGLQKIFIRKLNVVIDLANPKLATGPRLTDANGDLQFILPMPGIQGPLDVWFQAVQQRNVTNFVPTQLIP